MRIAYRDRVRNHLIGWGRTRSGADRLVNTWVAYIDDAERIGTDAEVLAEFLHWKVAGNPSLVSCREYQALASVPYVWSTGSSGTDASCKSEPELRRSAERVCT